MKKVIYVDIGNMSLKEAKRKLKEIKAKMREKRLWMHRVIPPGLKPN